MCFLWALVGTPRVNGVTSSLYNNTKSVKRNNKEQVKLETYRYLNTPTFLPQATQYHFPSELLYCARPSMTSARVGLMLFKVYMEKEKTLGCGRPCVERRSDIPDQQSS